MCVLKEKVNPVEIKVGITSLKALRDGRVLTEASSRNEINLLGDKIREECAETLAVNMQTLRKPRMIILNTPTEITRQYFRNPDTTKPRTSHGRRQHNTEIRLQNKERN
jgi:hypothetical protein